MSRSEYLGLKHFEYSQKISEWTVWNDDTAYMISFLFTSIQFPSLDNAEVVFNVVFDIDQPNQILTIYLVNIS